jgi:NADPH2:quinone reductase
MRAALVRRFGDPDVISVETVPDPHPGEGEIVIDVAATAVNFVDLIIVGGKYQFVPELPFTPGKLPAGKVSAVGSGVTSLKVGDRVLTTAERGGYAQKALARACQSYLLPNTLSFVDAAAMALAFDTAWFALRTRARLQAGEIVLVLGGSGAVGLAAIQLAKAFGARVIAGVSSPDKTGLVEAAGADATVDLGRPDVRESLRDAVHALTEGRGADVVIDPLGDRFFGAALRALAWSGRLVVIGFAAGEIPSVKANYLLVKNIEVSGLQVSDYRTRSPELMAQCFDEVFRLHAAGTLHGPPSAIVQLDDVAAALMQLRDRKVSGRLVVTP